MVKYLSFLFYEEGKRDRTCSAEGENDVCLVFCGGLRSRVKPVFCGELVLYLSCF
jgi:hypothetical protein